MSIHVTRSPNNPMVDFGSSPSVGDNINGASVIRVPSWANQPLGKYYMYFAHHHGDHIRLAYADDLHGPWKVHEGGVLRLDQLNVIYDHIASPDVHIDEGNQKIYMYFHGLAPDRKGQWTALATSDDGLNFASDENILGQFYFRKWTWSDQHYAIAKAGNTGSGVLYRSDDHDRGFKELRGIIPMVRHAAVMVIESTLYVFFSRKGDAPESILLTKIDMDQPWQDWDDGASELVLEPIGELEGMSHPNLPSEYGSSTGVRQLRDPCVFRDEGKNYLFYSYAGEEGIALAEFEFKED